MALGLLSLASVLITLLAFGARRPVASEARTAAAAASAADIETAAPSASSAPEPAATPRKAAGPRPVKPAPDGRLTWAPPPCGDASHACATYLLQNTGQHQFLALSALKDWTVKLPPEPLEGGLDINGGHNVIIIGGEIDLPTPCATDGNVCHGINISRNSNSTGEGYIEGVLIRNPDPSHSRYTGDGIDVNTSATANVTLQNVRIEGIDGCDANGNSAHADVFQPYGANGAVLHVDHLTGTTDFQGMEINPDTAAPSSGVYKNVNIRVLSNPHSGCAGAVGNHYVWWLTAGNDTCATYPITLTNVFAGEPASSLQHNAIWPDTDVSLGCAAVYSGGLVTWPKLPSVSGGVRNGLPPGGDFVPAGRAGTNYVSPGYQ